MMDGVAISVVKVDGQGRARVPASWVKDAKKVYFYWDVSTGRFFLTISTNVDWKGCLSGAKVDDKSRIIIPSEFRRSLEPSDGMQFYFMVSKDDVSIAWLQSKEALADDGS